ALSHLSRQKRLSTGSSFSPDLRWRKVFAAALLPTGAQEKAQTGQFSYQYAQSIKALLVKHFSFLIPKVMHTCFPVTARTQGESHVPRVRKKGYRTLRSQQRRVGRQTRCRR